MAIIVNAEEIFWFNLRHRKMILRTCKVTICYEIETNVVVQMFAILIFHPDFSFNVSKNRFQTRN